MVFGRNRCAIQFFLCLLFSLHVGNDNETDYHREVYWHRCCSTSTPTTSPYTPTCAASSTQTYCASRRKETDFNNIEASLTPALSTMTTYYDINQLRANPSKTQVCAFHLRNREAKRELNVVWNGTRLSNKTTPVYLGIHLDRTLCYNTHIEKAKMKVNTRNNIIRKLANSKWGCKASTLRPSCLDPLLLSC